MMVNGVEPLCCDMPVPVWRCNGIKKIEEYFDGDIDGIKKMLNDNKYYLHGSLNWPTLKTAKTDLKSLSGN